MAIAFDHLIARRSKGLDASGIRKIFELGARIPDKVDLSIGQPDFDVPEPIKDAAINAIRAKGRNGYTLTQGIPELKRRIASHLHATLGWPADTGERNSGTGMIVTAGTSGALHMAMLAVLDPGDQIIVPDPYFVAYPQMAALCEAQAVRCDTYPDFRMTAARIEPLITARTKAVLIDSPANPTGVVLSARECQDVLDLCRRRNLLLISDEIYDEFCFDDSREDTPYGRLCPSPARFPGAHEDVLLIRGFGKAYGCTGWRMGYCTGPSVLIEEMSKVQQYSFVCAPSMAQWGCLAAFDCDLSPIIAQFRARRDRVVAALSPHTQVATPGGAFYAFVKVPDRFDNSGRRFFEAALERKVLVIPGGVFSDRDTHFRLSFAVADHLLDRGLESLAALMR